jgi:hypothetical protein
MEANELRIGNWVKDKWLLSFFKVIKLGKFKVTYKGFQEFKCDYEHLQLISLTEEILLKCGFVKKRISLTFNEFSFYNEDLENVYIDLDQGQELSGISVKVKYLHQLQNLYFALTGRELQFKL